MTQTKSPSKLEAALHGVHRRTFDRIFRHPLSHTLEWREVRSLFGNIGAATDDANGRLTVARNGHTLALHPSLNKEVSVEDLIKLRHFLQRCEEAGPDKATTEQALLVINHHEARFFKSLLPGTAAEVIAPAANDEAVPQERAAREFARGRERPAESHYFSRIAHKLTGAQQVVVFGSGKGTSSEMTEFTAWLRTHDAALASRVTGEELIDESRFTEAQLLEKARSLQFGPKHGHSVAHI